MSPCWFINLPVFLTVLSRHFVGILSKKNLHGTYVMGNRRRRQRSLVNHSDRHVPNNMDQLTFKYMEMCKVESSTDSDSEISPRWSDTSTMGCMSSAPESGTSRRPLSLTHKPAGRHGCYSLFLDPYDGSSEDSDESNTDAGVSSRQTRQQGKCGGGGCRLSGRSRRFILHHPASVALREVVKNGMRSSFIEQQHHTDVQMKCGSDFELDALPSHGYRHGCRNVTEETTRHTQIMDIESQLDDSGLQAARSSTPLTTRPQMLDSSSERSPSSCNLRPFYKRKLPGADTLELGQRKRQCVISMEDDQAGRDSAPEPC